MTSALLTVVAIAVFVAVMAVGYLVISRILDNAERRRKERQDGAE
jgi:hypothetical protein